MMADQIKIICDKIDGSNALYLTSIGNIENINKV